MSKSKPKFKIDTVALLNYALQILKTDRAGLQKKMATDLQLDRATLLETRDTPVDKEFAGQQLHSRECIWNTPRAAIKTTLYNRIKGVQLHPQQPRQHSKPQYRQPTAHTAQPQRYVEPREYSQPQTTLSRVPTVIVKRKRTIEK